jgi:DNA invertase Pin-like site-specific DNA recombinase
VEARPIRPQLARPDNDAGRPQKARVKFKSLTEAIDTETPTGRAMWQMIGLMAEFERSIISERTRAGVKDAQGRGVKFGRKRKLTAAQIAHAREQIESGKKGRHEIAALFKVDRATLYRALAA